MGSGDLSGNNGSQHEFYELRLNSYQVFIGLCAQCLLSTSTDNETPLCISIRSPYVSYTCYMPLLISRRIGPTESHALMMGSLICFTKSLGDQTHTSFISMDHTST